MTTVSQHEVNLTSQVQKH